MAWFTCYITRARVGIVTVYTQELKHEGLFEWYFWFSIGFGTCHSSHSVLSSSYSRWIEDMDEDGEAYRTKLLSILITLSCTPV
jgi:hypothetical protein